MAEAKPKYVRLTSAERESVIHAFKEPLLEAAQKTRNEASLAPGQAVYEAAIPEEVRKVLPMLQKHGYTTGITTLYVHSTAGHSNRVELGKTYQNLYSSGHEKLVSRELVAACEEVQRVYSLRENEISKLAAGIDSAARACKTRYEFGQVWPALYDLMGKDWVEAEIDQGPRSLPVVVDLEGATAAVAQIKKAA